MAHKAVSCELDQLDAKAKGGLLRIFSVLTSGRLKESPFPKVALCRLKCFVPEFTDHATLQLKAGQILQDQPVAVLLLGSFLKAVGGPVWVAWLLYAVGVPLGSGALLPGAPEGFPLEW